MKKIKLNKFKNKLSQDADVYIPIKLEHTYKEIADGDINHLIDNKEVYNTERDNSNIYRVTVNVKPVFTNILTSLSLVDGLGVFNNVEFKNVLDPINSGIDVKTKIKYKDSLYKNIINKDGWLGYHKVIGLNRSSNFTELAPKKHDIDLFDEDDYENWSFSLYYIYKKEPINLDNGLPVISYKQLDYGNRILENLGTSISHNLKIGDKVYLGGLSNGGDGEYRVLDIGNEVNEFKENFFTIDLPDNTNITPNTYLRKSINGVHSEYYYRKIKKVPTSSGRVLNKNSYKILEAGFSQTIYGDKIGNVMFYEDINLSNIVDYQNRPPLEIIFTAFKERKTKNGTNYFTTLKSGLNLTDSLLYSTTTPNIKKINSNTYNYFFESNLTVDSNDITYDVVEYNPYDLSEKQLNVVNFRFNLIDRESTSPKTITDDTTIIDLGTRNEGYFYNPFLSIKILNESDYVEYGDEFDEIPYYAKETSGGYIWKDIISKSKNLNISYPFVNGVHNIMVYYNLHQKRQDPFNKHGIRYNNFPADFPGESNSLKTDDTLNENLNDEC